MSAMIDNLDRLNRKERFFFIGMVLGNRKFKLDALFRRELSDKFGIVVTDTAFVAMDYHLNWIYAAAALTFGNPVRDRLYDNKDGVIDGTQEDVDLLVAFEDAAGVTHLIMLEAKGVTAFSNRQFEHKISRFRSIFGENGNRWPKVKPYFGLVSRRESKGLRVDRCPSWLKVNGKIPWFMMPIPEDRLTVFGCDEQGRPNHERAFWTVRRG
ncbi:MAG: hypothetical protein E3J65_00720 [Dehalococcoidia bacterium]|nr:MAG: hypothetical protein E3J65_00720 [Dehalococcoidia bacterium]